LLHRYIIGILAAVDCRADDGGFHAIPGFQHHAYSWAAANRERCYRASRTPDPTSVQIAKTDPIRHHIQRMPIRAGSLLIWNSLLPVFSNLLFLMFHCFVHVLSVCDGIAWFFSK
jgi:ectoine hydroxylase-related dioxygenase (phytanoyl-CoA dioxygenase family)